MALLFRLEGHDAEVLDSSGVDEPLRKVNGNDYFPADGDDVILAVFGPVFDFLFFIFFGFIVISHPIDSRIEDDESLFDELDRLFFGFFCHIDRFPFYWL